MSPVKESGLRASPQPALPLPLSELEWFPWVRSWWDTDNKSAPPICSVTAGSSLSALGFELHGLGGCGKIPVDLETEAWLRKSVHDPKRLGGLEGFAWVCKLYRRKWAGLWERGGKLFLRGDF